MLCGAVTAFFASLLESVQRNDLRLLERLDGALHAIGWRSRKVAVSSQPRPASGNGRHRSAVWLSAARRWGNLTTARHPPSDSDGGRQQGRGVEASAACPFDGAKPSQIAVEVAGGYAECSAVGDAERCCRRGSPSLSRLDWSQRQFEPYLIHAKH